MWGRIVNKCNISFFLIVNFGEIFDFIYIDSYRYIVLCIGVVKMNIAVRKLAMLEKQMNEQEERSRVEGYSQCPIDRDFKARISTLLDRVRVI
jgi:hypothetical protein